MTSSPSPVRKTISMCPECMQDVPAEVILDEGKAWLRRECPEHGSYRFLLSQHGTEYAELDDFFFNVIDGRTTSGRITNYWVLLTQDCQQKCPYCSVDVTHPFCNNMSEEKFDEALRKYAGSKLTFSGGEPTMHPRLLDFFLKARERRVITQLATNGLKLVNEEYCRSLKAGGVSEVRISFEYWNPPAKDCMGTSQFIETKRTAMENCLAVGMPLVPSPTIMKGCNEDVLIESLLYAFDKPGIKEVSANGFSWNGSGKNLDKELMIMPDEMVDTFHRHYGGSRGDYFTLAKMLFAVLHLLDIRLCLYTQVLIFVRTRKGIRPINDYLNMKRMKRGLERWSFFRRLPRWLSLPCFVFCLLPSVSRKTIPLLPAMAMLFLSNIFGIKISKYPRRLLPVVLNTNCSPLSADNDVVPRCMSGVLFETNGELTEDISTLTLRYRVTGQKGN